MNDTYSGGVIHINHGLTLMVKTPNCITDPSIIVPLRIGNKSLTNVGIGSVSNAHVYGAFNPSVVNTPSAITPNPVNIGFTNQDSESVLVPSAPPSGWSNPVVYSSVSIAAADSFTTMAAVSFDSLLAEMEKSLNDLDIVTTRCNDPDWDIVLSRLTPLQYGQCVSKV